MEKQRVWFFYECMEEAVWGSYESRGTRLWNLLQAKHPMGGTIAQYMASKNYGLIIAMRGITETMKQTIHFLNDAGVPVKIWLVTTDTNGYWTNAANVQAAIVWFNQIKYQILSNNLKVEGIGIDLEISLGIAELYDRPFEYWPEVLRFNRRWAESKQISQVVLDDAVHASPIPIEFYAFQKPFHKLIGGGLYPTPGYKVVSMDYTSYFPAWLQSFMFKMMRRFAFPGSISAMGILGVIDGRTPGRLLGKKLPRHMDGRDVLRYLVDLKKLNGGQLPQELYVFAFENEVTLRVFDWAMERVV